MDSRRIEFEGIPNARDLGGLPAAQGRRISPGLLIRSASLAAATEADVERLRTRYHLSVIIDLRTGVEREERPDAVVEAACYRPIPVFESSTLGISHEKRDGGEQQMHSLPQMAPLYKAMVTDPSCLCQLGVAARCIMEHDFSAGSVLWHCTEGKDRCGLLSAIVLMALGVERGDIIEDYLLTNRTNLAKAEGYYRKLLAAGRPAAEAEAVRDVFLAKREYIDAALSAIDAQFGSTDAFLHDGLGIPQALTEHFRESTLVRAAG